MILKALNVQNIRSYTDETRIEFPLGISLFEGDIASGKSTLLYAIEFGLFGLGSLKGSFLLRNGAKRGEVTLGFEAGGADYEVHRSLVRTGKSIQQEECFIRGPKGKAQLATTDLKERVLQILHFNEPTSPKAQSVIYRYAVFTPQEEMKEVILKKPDERLQTLRRAFGIEDYKVAAENASALVTDVRERVKFIEGATKDLPSLKEKLIKTDEDLRKQEHAIEPLTAQEENLKEQRKEKKDELKGLEGRRESIRKTEGLIPQYQKQIKDKTQQRHDALAESGELADKVKNELAPRIAKLSLTKKPTDLTKLELKQSIAKLRKNGRQMDELKTQLSERINNFESLIQKKQCPVCERDVDPKDFRGRTRHLEQEKNSLEVKAERLQAEIEKSERLVDDLEEYTNATKELDTLKSTLKDTNSRIGRNKKDAKRLGDELRELDSQLKAAQNEVVPLRAVLTQIDSLEKQVEGFDDKIEELGRNIAAAEKEIDTLKQYKKETSDLIRTKETQIKFKDQLSENKIWLNEYFTPTVENIERHVMASLNTRFNQQFQKWFQILIEDPDLQVRVDEEFSPVIERSGYEQEYLQISGGERTSVALAYRLALNTTVQEVAIAGESNLLILDEPTDGFSREQLFKLRDILNELKCPQVIMVSHERELEGFCDHVFRIEQAETGSKISSVK